MVGMAATTLSLHCSSTSVLARARAIELQCRRSIHALLTAIDRWRQGSPAAAAKAPWSMDGSRKEQQDKKMPACLPAASYTGLNFWICICYVGSNFNHLPEPLSLSPSLTLSPLCVYAVAKGCREEKYALIKRATKGIARVDR